MTSAVQCQEVRKRFGSGDASVEVLRGVNFEALSGEMTYLVGPSGCGKTTLISIIAGLLEPTEGRVELFGRRMNQVDGRDLEDFRRKNLGFVFQQYNLIPSLTAAENAAIPLVAAGMGLREGVGRSRQLLEHLGIGHRADQLPKTLSGGQQQRVALARALVHEPVLVICDEPTAALDHESGEAVMRLLNTSAVRPDRAVIVVTHDRRIFHFADQIAFMNDGVVTHVERQARKGKQEMHED